MPLFTFTLDAVAQVCQHATWLAGCAKQGGLASLVALVGPGVFALSEVSPALLHPRLLLCVLSPAAAGQPAT